MAVVAVAGCQSRTKATPTPAVQMPDGTALQTARRFEEQLLTAYDAQIRRTPLPDRGPLQVERAIHATHLLALHGTPASRGAAARHGTSTQSMLRSSARELRRLALAATNGPNAALFASIAASHTASAG